MSASTIANEGNIPILPVTRKQEREVVSLSEIRLNLTQVLITIVTICGFFIAIGLGLGRLNAIEDNAARFERTTNERFDKIQTTLEAMQKDIHQQSIDIAQLKQQMVDTKGKR